MTANKQESTAEVDYAKLCQELEVQEVESPGGVATATVYGQLLAIYLLQNDLNNAKFLWKRIPQSIKSSNEELGQIWAVGQVMWQREFPKIYESVRKDWSEPIRPIMAAIAESTCARAANLVAQAYSSINADELAAFVGMPVDEAVQAAVSKGWQADPQDKMVTPKKPELPTDPVIPNEQQLARLTDFVSFLEN